MLPPQLADQNQNQWGECPCPNPDCSSRCAWCGGKGNVPEVKYGAPVYKTQWDEKRWWSEELHTGFEFIGLGEESFRRYAMIALELVGLGEANSCGFTTAEAEVSAKPAVHWPLTHAAVRRPPVPWPPRLCVDKLWGWLQGFVPAVAPAILLPRQNYVHVKQSGPIYPPPPLFDQERVAQGRETKYKQGYLIKNLCCDNPGILVYPAWVLP